jgi:outer membrane biosynthesis protein TonB
MAEQARSGGSAFLKVGVPCLVLGLVVGGLAGAFLTPVIESGSMSALTTDPSKPIPRTPSREDRPNADQTPAEPVVKTPSEPEAPVTTQPAKPDPAKPDPAQPTPTPAPVPPPAPKSPGTP